MSILHLFLVINRLYHDNCGGQGKMGAPKEILFSLYKFNITMLSLGILYLYYRQALFVNSVFTAKPIFVKSKELRVFQKIKSLQIFFQLRK